MTPVLLAPILIMYMTIAYMGYTFFSTEQAIMSEFMDKHRENLHYKTM